MWAVISGYLLLQVGASIAQAAQQGFIPDLIPPTSCGRASGLKNFMDIGGAMFGFVLLGQLLGKGQLSAVFWILGSALVAGYILTVWLVREAPSALPASASPLGVRKDLSHLNSSENQPFFWLIVSRFLFLLATYAVGRFLLFFVSDRLTLQTTAASRRRREVFWLSWLL